AGLRGPPADPGRCPLLSSLASPPGPGIDVQPGPLLRALLRRRASREAREELIDALGAHYVPALPLRGAADTALGILIAWPQSGHEPDLGALSAFSLQASLALSEPRCARRAAKRRRSSSVPWKDGPAPLRTPTNRLPEPIGPTP